jgi:hypothetical protein
MYEMRQSIVAFEATELTEASHHFISDKLVGWILLHINREGVVW